VCVGFACIAALGVSLGWVALFCWSVIPTATRTHATEGLHGFMVVHKRTTFHTTFNQDYLRWGGMGLTLYAKPDLHQFVKKTNT
jgi:hypothetical protein